MTTDMTDPEKLKAMFLRGELPYHFMVMTDGEVLEHPLYPVKSSQPTPRNTRPPQGLYALVSPLKPRLRRRLQRRLKKLGRW